MSTTVMLTAMTTGAFPAVPATDQLGDFIGDSVAGVMSSSLDAAMQAIWQGATWLLGAAFGVADAFSSFTVDIHSGPVGAIWPTLLSTSAAIALGLFFWQLTMASLRGGRGMMRVATGPVAYGVALAITVGGVAALLTIADGLTQLILTKGLNVTNFSAAFTHTSLGGQAVNGIKAVALGLVGFFGVIPAALGWVLEIIWRQAAILVLVATVPITAAGLLAQTTASWFWRGLRWTLAAVAVKPVLALIVVLGVSALAGADGPAGLLAGVGVLWVSLTAPMALFRLLAFVDPDTDAGATFREQFAQFGSQISGGAADTSHAGFDSPGGGGAGSGGGSGSGSGGGMGALESANTDRFDAASGGSAPTGGGDQDMAAPPPSDPGSSAGSGSGAVSSTGSSAGAGGGDDVSSAAGSPPPPQPPDAAGSGPSGGGGAPVPGGPGGSGGGGSSGSGSGGAAAGGSEAVEAAVLL